MVGAHGCCKGATVTVPSNELSTFPELSSCVDGQPEGCAGRDAGGRLRRHREIPGPLDFDGADVGGVVDDPRVAGAAAGRYRQRRESTPALSPASMAGLPASGSSVRVGPPLFLERAQQRVDIQEVGRGKSQAV